MNVRWEKERTIPAPLVYGKSYKVKAQTRGIPSRITLEGVSGTFFIRDFEVIGKIEDPDPYPIKVLAFGVGSARCGSKSLRRLFEGQPATEVTHEAVLFPWVTDEEKLRLTVDQLLTRRAAIVGDIGPWYLPYVERLMKHWKAKVICLKRDKTKTVDSFLRQKYDHCSTDPAPAERPGKALYGSLPKFSGISRREAAERYWEYYYTICDDLARRFSDHFQIWPTECLNYEDDQRAICEFIGVPPEEFRPVNVDPRYTQYACSLFSSGAQ